MKANFLIDFEDEQEVYQFETWLKQYVNFKVTIVTDTSKLWEDKDSTFIELYNNQKKARKLYQDYINKQKLK